MVIAVYETMPVSANGVDTIRLMAINSSENILQQ